MADKYGIMFAQIPIDNELLKTTQVPDDGVIPFFAVPSAPGCRVEALAVAITYNIVPVDGTDALTGDVIFHDASADSDTVLLDDVNLKSTNTNIVANEAYTIWQGCQSLDPGDTLRLALTITTLDTAALGGLITVAYRVKEWNGQ